LPDIQAVTDEEGMGLEAAMHRSTAWATTFSASLELAKQGDLALAQGAAFTDVHISRISSLPR
jgi:chromatin segregation and condensation protein Rec8/ScpA/Scc1 (kleisin family)